MEDELPIQPKPEPSVALDDDRLELALQNYAADRMTLGQAAELAGLSQSVFMHQLGKRQIPIHYGMDELKEDIAAAREISEALARSRVRF